MSHPKLRCAECPQFEEGTPEYIRRNLYYENLSGDEESNLRRGR